MRIVLFRVWPLLPGIVLIMLGTGMHFTLIGLRGGIEGFSAAEPAIVTSSYFVGFLSGARFSPLMSTHQYFTRRDEALLSLNEPHPVSGKRSWGLFCECLLQSPERQYKRTKRCRNPGTVSSGTSVGHSIVIPQWVAPLIGACMVSAFPQSALEIDRAASNST